MQRMHRRLISSLLAAPLVLAGSLLVGTGVAGPNSNPSLGDSVRTLRAAPSMAIEAIVAFITTDPSSYPAVTCDGYPTYGTYSYRANGQAWLIKSYLDSTRFKGMNSELSFDGNQEFVARSDNEIVSISEAGEPSDLGMSLPNPIFALASYARPVNDANIGSPLKLSDLKSINDGALDASTAVWVPVQVDGLSLERTVLPGDTLAGHSYAHYVYVVPGKRTEPVRVDRVIEDGTVLTRYDFTDWKTADGVPEGTPGASRFPRNVKFIQYRAGDGAMLYQANYLVTKLKLGAPVATDELTVTVHASDHLYQADKGEYIN
ncbi:MAG: hypothetical protein U0572_11940 [Phycisphaerales bacterium]